MGRAYVTHGALPYGLPSGLPSGLPPGLAVCLYRMWQLVDE